VNAMEVFNPMFVVQRLLTRPRVPNVGLRQILGIVPIAGARPF